MPPATSVIQCTPDTRRPATVTTISTAQSSTAMPRRTPGFMRLLNCHMAEDIMQQVSMVWEDGKEGSRPAPMSIGR